MRQRKAPVQPAGAVGSRFKGLGDYAFCAVVPDTDGGNKAALFQFRVPVLGMLLCAFLQTQLESWQADFRNGLVHRIAPARKLPGQNPVHILPAEKCLHLPRAFVSGIDHLSFVGFRQDSPLRRIRSNPCCG